MCERRIVICGALILSMLGLAGCQENKCEKITVCDGQGDADLIKTSYNAIDCLVDQEPMCPAGPVLVTSMVNLNDIDDTSAFGRLAAGFLAGRLAQHKYGVVHATVRKGSLVVDSSGKLLLSDELKELAELHGAPGVLVSTYMLGSHDIYISLKLVDVSNDQVLGAVDYAIPKGPRTMVLLRRGQEMPHTSAAVYDANWDPTLR